MRSLIETDAFDVIQVPMSLIRIERIEEEVLGTAADHDMGVVVNFPTVNGILARDIGVFADIFGKYIETPCQGALMGPLLHPAATSVLSGMSTPEIADENCAVGKRLSNISGDELDSLWKAIDELGIGPCRSCGRCAPWTGGISVPQIMTYHDAWSRFRIEAAKENLEDYRQQVAGASSFEGADGVCPEGFDVLKEVKRRFE